tara:strand:- start:292 stop:1167 length:876 start_codon:yes stop_codon:yes gene_type:complete
MEQEKRRAGRPKKTESAPSMVDAVEVIAEIKAPEPVAKKPTVKKMPKLKRKESEFQNKEFEVPRGGGVALMLPQKGVAVFDEEKDTVREIRYCPNEPSIYTDEQSKNAVKQSVVFRDGKLFVPKDKPNLRKFLEVHPQNIGNGGKTFREVNKKRDAENQLKKEFVTNDAISMVRDREIGELLPVALYFNINIDRPVTEIRYDLLQIAKKKPSEFIKSFDSPQVVARSIVKQAGDYQILNIKKDGVYWFDSNSLIVSVPVGQDALDVMVRFCLTEKGASVLSTLEERLEKLA